MTEEEYIHELMVTGADKLRKLLAEKRGCHPNRFRKLRRGDIIDNLVDHRREERKKYVLLRAAEPSEYVVGCIEYECIWGVFEDLESAKRAAAAVWAVVNDNNLRDARAPDRIVEVKEIGLVFDQEPKKAWEWNGKEWEADD